MTSPISQLNQIVEGTCGQPISIGCGFASNDESTADTDAGFYTSTEFDPYPTSTIEVVSEGQVGPYETVVLQAGNEEALLDYLQDAGYDLPDSLDAVLAPYVGADAHFVAHKLASNRDVGDITPLGLRYAATRR